MLRRGGLLDGPGSQSPAQLTRAPGHRPLPPAPLCVPGSGPESGLAPAAVPRGTWGPRLVALCPAAPLPRTWAGRGPGQAAGQRAQPTLPGSEAAVPGRAGNCTSIV